MNRLPLLRYQLPTQMYGRGAQIRGENYKQIVSKFSPLVFIGLGTVCGRSGVWRQGVFRRSGNFVSFALILIWRWGEECRAVRKRCPLLKDYCFNVLIFSLLIGFFMKFTGIYLLCVKKCQKQYYL
jgi:hypothetical protein